jgi:ribosomal protein S18 acetylase RimI-like enzyme
VDYGKNYFSQGEIELEIAEGKNSLNPDLNKKKDELETLMFDPELNSDWFVRVACNPRQIIGIVISGIEKSYKWSKKYGVIADIVVKSEFKGKGVGRELVEDAENLLRSHSARKIFIEINDKNDDSKDFFSILGYETIAITAWIQLDT